MPDLVESRRLYVETVSDRVRMTTIVGRNGCFYGVEVKEGEEWVGVWDETVLFGRDKAHRAGGSAFKFASSYQESLAAKEAGK